MSRTVALAALAALLAAPVAAAPTAPPAPSHQASVAPAPAKKPKVLVDLQPEEVDARRLLAPPFVDGSPRAQAELAELHRVIAAASPARMAQARWDDAHEDPSLFQPTLGLGFDLGRLPATAAYLAVVQGDADFAASAAKRAFPRKRPWAVDGSIPTCDPDDKPLTSYPSGHATLGYSLAMALALAMPERETELMARASDYAFSREVCGSHFASDTQASQALAAAMVTALSATPAFRERLRAARTELASSGLARAPGATADRQTP